jgi:hypothetical protein
MALKTKAWIAVLAFFAAVLPATANAAQLCASDFKFYEGQLRPPDGTYADNAPAAAVSLRKDCVGTVVVRFSAEVSAPANGDFIDVAAKAQCLRAGGLANGCSSGDVVFGEPGAPDDTIKLAHGPIDGMATYSTQWIFRGLQRGVWRFLVLPAGNDNAFMLYRSFTVDAYQGN